MEENIKKELRWAKALTGFEGIVFFLAGVCTLMTGTILGYISGGLLVAAACLQIFPVFFRDGKILLNMAESLTEDEDVGAYVQRVDEEEEQNENA